MGAPREFVQLDVEGDGNCFYRAVYGAAKYHPYGILERFLLCLDLPTYIDEDDFCHAIRQKLVDEIMGDLFERMRSPDGDTLYETLREAAQLAADGEPLLWESALAEASDEFQERFSDADNFLRLSLDDFKGAFAEIIANSGVYASEMDYKILEFLLAQCGIDLISVNPAHNERPALLVERRGRPVLLVRRLLNLEHYSFLLPKEVYEEHKSELSEWRRNRKIYRMVEANTKASHTRKSPKSVTKKSITIRKTRKSKSAPSSNNNANLAAAIAASMANASNRR
jgi:hypothetical protein